MLKIPALACCLCVISSATSPSSNEVGQEFPQQWPRSTQLEATWGTAKSPSMLVTGQQAISYIKPTGGSVDIAYEGKSKPRDITTYDGRYSRDGTLSIMGQQVAYYFSGNEDPAITTQALQLTDPAGRQGWFSFQFSAPEHLKGKNIPAFQW
jgi:hypothetical protein